MLHRIRLACKKDGGKLGGEVEVDETFIGGKARNMHATLRPARSKGSADLRVRPSSLRSWNAAARSAPRSLRIAARTQLQARSTRER